MYIVVFVDNTEFIGGNPSNSKWNELPNRAIKSVKYQIKNKTILFSGFESYNHIVEKIFIVQKNSELLSKIILMGKTKEKIITYTYDLLKNNGYFGNEVFGKEYLGKSTSGWKRGFEEQTPTFKIL